MHRTPHSPTLLREGDREKGKEGRRERVGEERRIGGHYTHSIHETGSHNYYRMFSK